MFQTVTSIKATILAALLPLISAAAGGRPALEAAGVAYREVLTKRFENYRRTGLAGIEDYARKGRKVSTPSTELKSTLAKSPILANRLPALHRYLETYPDNPVEGVQERF